MQPSDDEIRELRAENRALEARLAAAEAMLRDLSRRLDRKRPLRRLSTEDASWGRPSEAEHPRKRWKSAGSTTPGPGSTGASLQKRRVSMEDLAACQSQSQTTNAPTQQSQHLALAISRSSSEFQSSEASSSSVVSSAITPDSSMANLSSEISEDTGRKSLDEMVVLPPNPSPIGLELVAERSETTADAEQEARQPLAVVPRALPEPPSLRLGGPKRRLRRPGRIPRLLQDFLLLAGLVLLVFAAGHGRSMWKQVQAPLELPGGEDCIYVTGGGFSGFWFSLGRLRALAAKHGRAGLKEHTYACYSAGCLGVVATYTNRSLEDLYDMAGSIQKDWQDGTTHRYQVVERFVDNLLGYQQYASRNGYTPKDGHSAASVRGFLDEEALASIRVLTSVPSDDGAGAALEGLLGFEAAMQTPRDVDHLRELLLQTTWIPYAVGSQYTHPPSGHLDGAFSTLQHPKCAKRVGLANDWALLSNTLNVNLPKEKVETFWNMGLAYGV